MSAPHMKANIIVGVTSVLLIISLSSFAKSIVPKSPIVSNKALASWHYASLKRVIYSFDFCDPNISNRANVHRQSVKSKKSVKGFKRVYYRYTLIREVYSDSAKAIIRFASIKKPARKTSKHSKKCYIRKTKRIGRIVYIIHTTATLFQYKEMSRILDNFVKYMNRAK